MCQDQKDVKHPEGGGGDCKEVDRDQLLGMVTEKTLPGLTATRAAVAGTVFADSRIRDVEAEFSHFGLETLTPPRGIGRPHLTDKGSQLVVQAGPASMGARFRAPKQARAFAMPAENCSGLDQHQRPLPFGRATLEQYPEKSIRGLELRFGCGAPQHHQLMTQGEVFEHEVTPGSNPGAEGAKDNSHPTEYGRRIWPRRRKNSTLCLSYGVFATHKEQRSKSAPFGTAMAIG